jgi:hypothetical protein
MLCLILFPVVLTNSFFGCLGNWFIITSKNEIQNFGAHISSGIILIV